MAAAGRFQLFAVPGVELPVLASKQLLVRRDFQRCDMLESAYSVEKLGCKVSDFASQVSMRGLRFG